MPEASGIALMEARLPLNLRAAALSDVGCVRTNNEDAFAASNVHGLYVVCDGMGGRAAGEVASALAAKTFLSAFVQATEPDTATGGMQEAGLLQEAVLMQEAIQAANAAVWQSAAESGHAGMGTTLVAAHVLTGRLVIGNVGDSRAYLLRDGVCTQLTADHSYVNELIRSGSIRLEDRGTARIRRLESVITRAIGAVEVVEADVFEFELETGDTLLLTSDGLTRYLDGPQIAALVDTSALEFSCARLVAAANEAGGVDNITCLLVRYDG